LFDMEITRELVRKFLANECDPEEFERVMHYLETHPTEAGYWLGAGDWDAIDGNMQVTDHDQQEVYARLRERLFPGVGETGEPSATKADAGGGARRPGLVRRVVWQAVAASLFLAGVGVWMSRRRVHAPEEAALATRTRAKVIDTLAAAGGWIVKTNGNLKPQQLVLPDGSGVTLYAHSRLTYTSGFGVRDRESRLEGVADFVVHINKMLPFTVHSGMLSTTALGTSFGVKAPAGSTAVAVKLYTGKVVVKADQAGWAAIFLHPGEQVSYDGKGGPALVSRFDRSPAGDKVSNDGQDLVFNNTALKQVFKQLAIRYHVTISYRAADLRGMNFTGTVSRSDSLQPLLKLLGNMNNLEIREEANGFRVVRQQ
jgi:ferric-dicitrate binding protein FerR (iron transport regulator)